MTPEYTHVYYTVQSSDLYPGDDPAWDPEHGHGMFVTACGPADLRWAKFKPSDCVWMIPGTKASEQYDG